MAFLRALSKMGLVELDATELQELEKKSKKEPAMSMEEIDKILAEEEKKDAQKGAVSKSASPAQTPSSATAPSSSASSSMLSPASLSPASSSPASRGKAGGIQIGKGFDLLYREAALSPSPYAAEKLLRLLEGLNAMDEATRKVAILAMDAADDTWTLADPVMDAKRKTKVLADVKSNLQEQLSAAEAAMQKEIANLQLFQEQAQKTIREKIAALENQLQKELQDVAQRRADCLAAYGQDKSAVQLEQERLDHELVRLQVVIDAFGASLREAKA